MISVMMSQTKHTEANTSGRVFMIVKLSAHKKDLTKLKAAAIMNDPPNVLTKYLAENSP
jgi:hypothetical protein